MLDNFWQNVDLQLDRVRYATTTQEVITALGGHGDTAFFHGSGGDTQILDVLNSDYFTVFWIEAEYYWAATDRAGKVLEYVEGDVYAAGCSAEEYLVGRESLV